MIMSINYTEEPIHPVPLPALQVLRVPHLEPGQPPPGEGLLGEQVPCLGQGGQHQDEEDEASHTKLGDVEPVNTTDIEDIGGPKCLILSNY